MFDFSAVLPEAVEQMGYRCSYVSRMWDEKELEKQRQAEGHAAIVDGIEHGKPAVVWDVAGDMEKAIESDIFGGIGSGNSAGE